MFAKYMIPIFFIATTSPAIADDRTQLERAAGVEHGVYALSELAQIVSAEEANDVRRIKRNLSHGNSVVTRAFLVPHVSTPSERGNQGSDR